MLYEGLIINNDIARCAALHTDGFTLHVVALVPPIEDCLAGIQARRAARGDTRALDPRNTIALERAVHRHVARLRAAGVDVRAGGRAEGLRAVLELLEC